jgi:hypothetical protein
LATPSPAALNMEDTRLASPKSSRCSWQSPPSPWPGPNAPPPAFSPTAHPAERLAASTRSHGSAPESTNSGTCSEPNSLTCNPSAEPFKPAELCSVSSKQCSD